MYFSDYAQNVSLCYHGIYHTNMIYPLFFAAALALKFGVMDEQTGSPVANPDNNSQRNGDEVRFFKHIVYLI